MALEVALRDQAEDACEAAPDVRFLLHVGGLEQVARHLLAARAGHLLDADDEHEAGAAGADRRHALVYGGSARGAGVLHVGGGREAHRVVHLQRQRGGEGPGRRAARWSPRRSRPRPPARCGHRRAPPAPPPASTLPYRRPCACRTPCGPNRRCRHSCDFPSAPRPIGRAYWQKARLPALPQAAARSRRVLSSSTTMSMPLAARTSATL